MPKVIKMYKKEIIKRLKIKQSKRSISRELNISRKVVNKIEQISRQNNWFKLPDLPSEKEILIYYKESFKHQHHEFDAIKNDIKNWYLFKYTYIVITKLINDKLNTNYSEITVRRYIKDNFPKVPKAIIRRKYTIGEIAEVDFGYVGMMYDILEKRNRKVYIFSMRFRYSRYAYRELVFNQKAVTFFNCHMNAFEYFNGVPKKIVCDNLKAAVIKAYFEDPQVNLSYYKLAQYYNFLISPNLPATPEHKGGVEKDMDYVKRNFIPIFKENQKLKGRKIPYYNDACEELKVWNEEVDYKHQIKYVDKTPMELFEIEKEQLNPLRFVRWDILKWYDVKVGVDWKIQVNKAFYSVPYQYVGKRVRACQNSKTVTVYFNYKVIAKHQNAKKDWERVENTAHGPKNYMSYLKTNSKNIKNWAKSLGNNIYNFCKLLLERTGVDGIRPAKALCSLSKKYGNQRLENACKRALYFKMKSFKEIKNILDKQLEELPLENNLSEFKSNMSFSSSRLSCQTKQIKYKYLNDNEQIFFKRYLNI
jgi:Transposase and inactivated derivatives